MKKRWLITSCLLLGSMLSGCNDKKVDTRANVSFEKNEVLNSRGESLTVGKIYDYILNNQKDDISKKVLLNVMREQIDFEDSNMLELYKKYLNQYFQETFVDNSTYKYNGEFSEELLVKYLSGESYIVKCDANVNSGLLNGDNFTCDYTDYIEKEVNFDIYMKMLKVKYVIDEKSSLIDKNVARRVTYYTVGKGSSDNEVREKLENYVNSIQQNYASTDENLIKNIVDIAETARKKDLEKVSEEYAYLSTSQDSSSGFTYLNKFTTCGDKRCSIEEGKLYQEKLIMDKSYYTSKIVTKSDENVLYADADKLLFSENLENYVYKIGDKNYLMSPAYIQSNDKRINDIILYDSASSNYYIVTVDAIDSDSSFEDKVLVAELLISKISDSIIYDYCFENVDFEIYDKNIKEYFETKYGNIDVE